MSDNENKRIFSDNLKKYMNLNGKTQIDIINDLHLDKSAVSTWCNGTRFPRFDKIQLLADYFSVSVSDLLGSSHDDSAVSSIWGITGTLPKKLTHFLESNGMTQLELASRMEVSTATVSNWCNGVKLPRMDKIDRICSILNINRSDLIEDKPQQDTSSAFSQLTPSVQKIIDIMQELNEEGQEKLLEYGDDLISSGKYIKSDTDGVVAG